MPSITEHNITDEVLNRTNTDEPRTKEFLEKLIKHVHAFVRDFEPTEAEWFQAIDFLTRTGHTCTGTRQEFILLSDVLGVSMLVDAINHRDMDGATETTVTGPFHTEAPVMEMGAMIATGSEAERGERTVVKGIITDVDGNPINGATVDVWQSDDIGYYDTQDVNQPDVNLRGLFTTGEDGSYWFRTIKPTSYPVPTDGPVGELLRAAGRHPMRPAHIHFWIKAEGYEQLITHIFVEGDEYIESDAVFGVKDSLVMSFVPNESSEEAARYGIEAPFNEVRYDFALKTAV
ncbi:MAG: intradiol ring-cleavage dioxygenase [Chloroflexota bacterium]